MLKKMTLNDLMIEVIIASIYVIFTFIFYFLSFEAIQFRIAEVLLILVFYNKRHMLGILLGTFIANWLGVFGFVDALFGTAATLLVLIMLILFKNKWVFAILLFPSLINSLIISLEIAVIYSIWHEYLINFLLIFSGELVVLLLLGIPIKIFIDKSPYIKELLEK